MCETPACGTVTEGTAADDCHWRLQPVVAGAAPSLRTRPRDSDAGPDAFVLSPHTHDTHPVPCFSPSDAKQHRFFLLSGLTPSAARNTGLHTKPYTPIRSLRTSNPRVERINSHPRLFLIRLMSARQHRGPPACSRGNLTSLLLYQK